MEANKLRAAAQGKAVSAETIQKAGLPEAASLSPSQLRQSAILHHKAGRIRQAIQLYNAALKAWPDDVALWSNLGAALRQQRQYQSAVNCYRRALELKPHDLTALGNLANVLKDMHRLEESLAAHSQVVAHKPADIQARMNYACALRETGRFEEALQQLERAQALDGANAGVEWERAQNLLYLGRYRQGWPAYEARWRTGELPQKDFGCPQWRGEPIAGKTILLHAEQGYGDTILAARYVALVKQRVGASGRVLLQCKPELHRLFAALGADRLLGPEVVEAADVHCPMMSLMGCFDTGPDTIPAPAILTVPAEARGKFEYLQMQHPGKTKIGIVWSGSLTFKNNHNRALPLTDFLPLAEQPDIRLYSLQKGPRQRDLYECGANVYIEDLGDQCSDFADTAAAIGQLDAIVMTDSSVAHLAGSLGKPVFNLLQRVPYWLYTLEAETTPWYPAMQLVQQDDKAEARQRMAAVIDKIRSVINNRKASA